jgi:PAS domain S-box-containing protein
MYLARNVATKLFGVLLFVNKCFMERVKDFILDFVKKKESLLYCAILIAGISLIGWVVEDFVLTAFSSAYIPMAPITAIIFIFYSVYLFPSNRFTKSGGFKTASLITTIILGVLCLLIFLNYYIGFNLDIESIIIKNPKYFGNIMTGRMSPLTAFLMVLVTAVAILFNHGKSEMIKYINGTITLFICIVSSVFLIGYLLNAPVLYGSNIIPVSLPTSVCFTLISVTMLRMTDVRFWSFNMIRKNAIEILLFKSFLPIVIFIVVLQGYLVTHFSLQTKLPTFSVAVILLMVIGVTVFIITKVSSIIGEKLHKSEQIIKDGETKWRTVFDNLPLGVSLVDQEGRLIDYNSSLLKILDKTKEEFENLNIETEKFYNSENEQMVKDDFPSIIAMRENRPVTNVEVMVKSKKGAQLWTEVSAVPVPLANITCAIITSDITQRKHSEAALKASEERFQLLFDKAPLGYQSLDINGCFIEVNQQWLDTLGYSREEIVGKWFGDFLVSEFKDAFRERFPIFKEKGKIHSEFEMVHKNGTKLFIAFEGRIANDIEGNFKQTHCILQDITIQKRATEAIQRSEQKLRFFTDNSPMAVIEWDSDFNVTRWSGDSEKIFGWKSAEALGKNIMELNIVYKEDIPLVETTIKSLHSGETRQIARNRNCRKDGKVISCDWYNTVLKDQAGNIVSVLSHALDVSEKMKSEEALRESENLYRSLFENILNGFAYHQMHYDENGEAVDYTYLSVNKAFEAQTGLFNAVGKKATELIPSFDKLDRELLNIYGQVAKNGEPRSFEIFVNSMRSWYSVSAYCPAYGYFVAIFENITERKNIEISLASSNQFNTQIISSVQEGIVVYDKNLKYTVWNPFMESITGIQASKALGKLPAEVFPFLETAGVIERLKICLEGGFPGSVDFQYYVPETGKSGWASDKNMPFLDVNGNVIGVIGTVYDITDRKNYEMELTQAKEKAEEGERLKTAFLANMSHEIRTPMNGILGFMQLLKEPDLTSKQKKEFLETMEKSGERMLNTLNDLIDISKIQSGISKLSLVESDINEQMKFIYKFFRPEIEAKGLKFILKELLPQDETVIMTDSEKVYAILTNLVKNAIKFTASGSIEIGCMREAGSIHFLVRDTGAGIPEELTQLIFERFRQGSESLTRNYEGVGLGLAISKSYVEMLTGRIWVESEVDKGSTFHFTIPYNRIESEKRDADETVGERSFRMKNLNILIAEDDETSHTLLSLKLKKISHRLHHAKTGTEAVNICYENRDIDLILMDIRMPELNGNDAARQIREFNKNVIIIAQTAYGFPDDREKALEAGCNEFITKPINYSLLDKLIEQQYM